MVAFVPLKLFVVADMSIDIYIYASAFHSFLEGQVEEDEEEEGGK